MAKSRPRAKGRPTGPTFVEALAQLGLIDEFARRTRAIKATAAAEADQLGQARLKVVACHTCTAAKGCCKLPTVIYLHDAVIVADRLRRDGRDTPALRAALRTSAEAMEQTRRAAYAAPCVFLDDAERCTVYDARPTACATALVFSDPAACNDRHSDAVIMFDTTAATEASLALAKEFYARLGLADRTGRSAMGMLPRMVLVALRAWDRVDYQTFLAEGDWAVRAAQATAE
ncbi:MAG: YkgJ family cysteine cluster protein [Kofleriaceae bacterium]